MKAPSVNKKTHLVNDAGDAETVGGSVKRSGGDDGGGSGESILPEMGDDDMEEEEEDEEGEEEEEAAKEERSKLDEGYFEIEAIRRKRVRKVSSFSSLHCSISYTLVARTCPSLKMNGEGAVSNKMPETANTWEPLENLHSIADVIDSFEGSLRQGKPGRKKKRNYAGPHSQSLKNKQQRLTYDAADKSDSSTSLNNSSLPGIRGPLDLSGYLATSQGEANSGSVGMFRQVNVSLVEEEKDYDPTLNELRRPVINSNGTVEGIGSEGDNVRANGFLKVDPKEFDENSRCIGAKRRKSGSVKRFKQEGTTTSNNIHNHNHTTTATTDQNLTPTLDSFGRTARIGNEYPSVLDNDNLSQKSKVEELDIVRIIKPVRFSSSITNNVQDALVTFSALRSDGKEVMVDNIDFSRLTILFC